MIEASLFTLASLVSIRYQRFVVAPMALAGAYAHQNTFKELAQPYVSYATPQKP